jgi:hypothetical protein
VYYFVIEFIIPSTASALKLRSKLNSSKLFESNTVHALAESNALLNSMHCIDQTKWLTVGHVQLLSIMISVYTHW